MNLIGKILVVLIFVACIAMMTATVMVYATHTDWRAQASALQTQLQQLNVQKSDLETQINGLKEDIDRETSARESQIAKLEGENQRLNTEYTELAREEAALNEERRQAIARMEAAQEELVAMRTDVEQLRTQIQDTQQDRDAMFRQSVDLQDQLFQAEGELERINERKRQLEERVARQHTVLSRNGLDEFAPVDGIPPRVDGLVLATGEGGLVEISLGSDDGLRAGHLLEVYRSNKYLGRIEVMKTAPDKSVAKVIHKYLQGTIQRDDRVASRLN